MPSNKSKLITRILTYGSIPLPTQYFILTDKTDWSVHIRRQLTLARKNNVHSLLNTCHVQKI